MKINDIFESTTSSGSVAAVPMPLGGTQKRQGSLFKGKKTNKKFYESEVSEAEVNEADLILVPGQGKKIKPGFIPKDQDRRDHEVEMARSDLFQAAKNAQKVYELIQHLSEEDGLEGWVQEKIIKANDYLNTIREYLEHKTYVQEELMGGVIAGGQVQEEEVVYKKEHINDDDLYAVDTEAKRIVAHLGNPYKNRNSVMIQKQKHEEQGHKVMSGTEIKYGEEIQLDEKQDACYHKVKSRYKVWPSAYASGALVKCRKVGAANWGNKSK